MQKLRRIVSTTAVALLAACDRSSSVTSPEHADQNTESSLSLNDAGVLARSFAKISGGTVVTASTNSNAEASTSGTCPLGGTVRLVSSTSTANESRGTYTLDKCRAQADDGRIVSFTTLPTLSIAVRVAPSLEFLVIQLDQEGRLRAQTTNIDQTCDVSIRHVVRVSRTSTAPTGDVRTVGRVCGSPIDTSYTIGFSTK